MLGRGNDSPSAQPVEVQIGTGAANPAASTNSPDCTSSSVHLRMNSSIARISSGVHAGPAAVSLPTVASMSAWEA